MAPTFDYLTKVITVPIGDLTLVSGSTYNWDVNQFRLDLLDEGDSQVGIAQPLTHTHNTQVTISGFTYARTLEIINGFTVTLPNSAIRVQAFGANHNIADVLNLNLAQLIVQNSAGLVNVTQVNEVWQRHGLDSSDPLDITDSSIVAGDISQTITKPSPGTIRVTRT